MVENCQGRVFVLGICLLFATSPGHAATKDAQASLIKSHRDFVSAEKGGRWDITKNMIYTERVSNNSADQAIDTLIRFKRQQRKAGASLQSETIDKIDYFRDGAHWVAFVDVVTVWNHPMHRPTPIGRRIYAFSEDSGSTWRFNVFDCISEEVVRRFAPAYKDFPTVKHDHTAIERGLKE